MDAIMIKKMVDVIATVVEVLHRPHLNGPLVGVRHFQIAQRLGRKGQRPSALVNQGMVGT